MLTISNVRSLLNVVINHSQSPRIIKEWAAVISILIDNKVLDEAHLVEVRSITMSLSSLHLQQLIDRLDVPTNATAKLESVDNAMLDPGVVTNDDILLTERLDTNVWQAKWKGVVDIVVKCPDNVSMLHSDVKGTGLFDERDLLTAFPHPRIARLLNYPTNGLTLEGNLVSAKNSFALEYINKRDLRNVLNEEHGAIQLQQSMSIMLDICEGMRFLHASGIIHGNLKSQSILIDESYHAKLSGFGSDRISMINKAPSKFDCNNEVNRASDIYAFGVLVWEIETGKTPWDAKVSKQAKLTLTSNEANLCSDGVKQLMDLCMDSVVEKRPSFHDLYELLTELIAKEKKREEDKHKAIPDGFLCPITQDIMKDPVILVGEGHSYERKSIQDWFVRSTRSPLTGNELAIEQRALVDNYALKSAIESFILRR